MPRRDRRKRQIGISLLGDDLSIFVVVGFFVCFFTMNSLADKVVVNLMSCFDTMKTQLLKIKALPSLSSLGYIVQAEGSRR